MGLEALHVLVEEGVRGTCGHARGTASGAAQDHRQPARPPCARCGLLIGVEIATQRASARTLFRRIADRGVLTKATHDSVIRFAPALTIGSEQIDEGAHYSPRPSTR
ncbi:MAG: aminotransferase class III-fold pyridoxal phosphate-dependent enzyme [Pseudomonadota bacterium]|nr:aminotransferase class III-fold pyridoxal phosphate-dependent enzyme [Pseudomonadota bacterium]